MGGGSVVVTCRWLLCASTALLWAVTYAGTFDSYLAGQSSTLTAIDIDDGTMSGTIPNTLHTDFPSLVVLKLQNTLISGACLMVRDWAAVPTAWGCRSFPRWQGALGAATGEQEK